jgi:hypothetical protein
MINQCHHDNPPILLTPLLDEILFCSAGKVCVDLRDIAAQGCGADPLIGEMHHRISSAHPPDQD